MRRSKVPAASCTDCHASTGEVDRILRAISITGALTDEQREGLTRIADRCPVHRSVHPAISVVTTLRATLDDQADAEPAQVD
ncbi:OsmC family protein [Agromyces bauzanensis]|uniref:Uncharacterized protein n=1 Tax=Agromyces bauzanensis TaxID=1308924 RepID=A0A917UW49_9MICO|nr:hypothetical protein [Agromyces bauzanensis]GGJ89737.1 hypothetical protein GCM10011372_30330 [Agromyces bauzanensis]